MNKYYHKLALAVLSFAASSFLGVACYPNFDYKEELGPNVRTSLLIFFKSDATSQQIQDFWNQVLSTPDPRGGHQLLAGICGVDRSNIVQGHDSVAVVFCRNSTLAQQAFIKAQVNASPIVFQMLADVVPNDVVKIE